MSTIAEALTTAIKHHQAGELPQAEAIYRKILEVDPANGDALHFLGVIAHQVGNQELAIQFMRQSIELLPFNEGYHSNLAHAYLASGRRDDAIASLKEALRLRPEYPEAHTALGAALADMGNLNEAIAFHQRALALSPNFADAHVNLGLALLKLGNMDEAEAHLRRAVRLRPDNVKARANLADAQRNLGRFDEAVVNLEEAVLLDPNNPVTLSNLGANLLMQGKVDAAVAAFQRALACDPNNVAAHSNLATALQTQGKLDEAEDHLRQAVTRQPDYFVNHSNLAGILQLQGNLIEAVPHYREAMRLNPTDSYAHSNLLLCMNYDPMISGDALLEAHREWGARYGREAPTGSGQQLDRQPERRLRVGYVSPDLCNNPVGQFLLPILANHDPQQVEAYCYANVSAPDFMTAKLKSLSRGWRYIHALTDQAASDVIRADKIDILVDLAGHTSGNRLRLFVEKLAPIQVTYLGYPCTTGLNTIDYLVTDAVADPPPEAAKCTEALIRLPTSFSCYSPPAKAPDVGPLPALEARHITFGSLNNLPKLSSPVLDAWAEILKALPSARLLVFRHTLQGRARDNLRRQMLYRGIDASRIDMRHAAPSDGFLSVYRDVDISLDSFPWSGHTTACESLWMGVPVITLRGNRHAGRMASSVLTQVGLNDWIADSQQHHADLAVRHSQDFERLAALRTQLREQVRNSPLCDGARFARELEAVYRAMWQRYCQS